MGLMYGVTFRGSSVGVNVWVNCVALAAAHRLSKLYLAVKLIGSGDVN